MKQPSYSKTESSRLWPWLKQPVVVIFGLSLVIMLAGLILAQQGWAYNSDDVFWQTVLFTWRPFMGHIAYVGLKDNFLINLPVILLVDWFLPVGRASLLATAAVMMAINFVLVYLGSLYFVKKAGFRPTYALLVPFIWLASLGPSISQLMLNTDWRNFEIGLSFIAFMLVAKVYFGEVKPLASRRNRWVTLGVCLCGGLLTYSDPYFLYFTILPIVLCYIILYLVKRVDRGQLAVILGGSVVVYGATRAIRFVIARIGVQTPGPTLLLPTLAYPQQLLPSISNTFSGWLALTGAQPGIAGQSVLAFLSASLNLVLLAFIVIATALYLFRRARPFTPGVAITAFFAALVVFVLAAFTASNAVAMVNDNRYLIIIVFAMALLLMLAIGHLKPYRQWLVAVVLIVSMVNLISSAVEAHQSVRQSPSPNKGNQELIMALQQLGLRKGYTDYWDGNINTYLSHNAVQFLPVYCLNNQTQPLHLLIDSSQFTKLAPRSFYLLNNQEQSYPTCSNKDVLAQFGRPEQVVHVAGRTIWIYSYDLDRKLN